MADVRFETIDLPNGNKYEVRFDGAIPTAVWNVTGWRCTGSRKRRMIWHYTSARPAGEIARAVIAAAKVAP